MVGLNAVSGSFHPECSTEGISLDAATFLKEKFNILIVLPLGTAALVKLSYAKLS